MNRYSKYLLIIFSVLFSNIILLAKTDDEFLDIAYFGEESSDSLVLLMSNLLNNYPEYTDEDYRNRLKEISGAIDYRLDPLVKERILIRTEKYRSSTEFILGKSDMYFPIFEEHLAKYNIPHHLKYLSVIESHLNPIAKSVASAVGLWQFIPSSGKLFGLKINSYVDERSDTYKASEAAARLLSVLFDKYNDWALAMAAYNCGSGRVDKAIKVAKSNDYWVVRNYLPKETQKYVPFFMAMVYVGEFYQDHDLTPTKIPIDLVLTDTVHIGGGISIFDLAKDLEISVDTLKMLNPAYRRNYIPQDADGQIIVLPARIVSQLRGYQTALDRVLQLQKNNPLKAVRRVKTERDLEWLCKAHRCEIADLLYWNELPSDYQPQEGDLIAIRKHNIAKNPIAIKRSVRTTSVYMNSAKFNDGIACTPSAESTVKAATRHRIQACRTTNNSSHTVSVPRAGSYEPITDEKKGSTRNLPSFKIDGVGLLPSEGNGTVISDLDDFVEFPIESSYIDNIEEFTEKVQPKANGALVPNTKSKHNDTKSASESPKNYGNGQTSPNR